MKTKIEFKNITKIYKKNIANNDISFAIYENEIHGLIGENGSGKSTLMSVLCGLVKKDSGSILINGKKVIINSSKDAKKYNIGILQQHFALVEELSVWQNVILGNELSTFNFLKIKKSKNIINELIKKYNFHLHVNDKIKNLSLSQRQLVEILKMLYFDVEIMVFDEPTSILSIDQIEKFYEILKHFRDEGKTIIFITHKLHEILALSDHCTVLRGGKFISTVDSKRMSYKDISALLLGEKLTININDKIWNGEKIPLLAVNNLVVKKKHNFIAVDGVSFDIYKGEIFAIAGASDNGQQELADCLSGFLKSHSGSISYKGKDITHHTVRKRQKNGMQFIPSDRLETGLVLDFSLRDNMLIGFLTNKKYVNHGFIKYKNTIKDAEKVNTDFNVKGINDVRLTPLSDLSGGNQQKVLIGKVLINRPPFILAFQPTWGIDIKSIQSIHAELIAARNAGACILLISYEIEEIFALADFICVMNRGKISKVYPKKEMSIRKVARLMGGET